MVLEAILLSVFGKKAESGKVVPEMRYRSPEIYLLGASVICFPLADLGPINEPVDILNWK